jgi:two-component system, cell cycle sensor histidine kinase PleC
MAASASLQRNECPPPCVRAARPSDHQADHRDYMAGDLVVAVPPIDPEASCEGVFELFLRYPEWPAQAVVDRQGKVVGLIGRDSLFATFAKPFLRDLYQRRPILQLSDPRPLIVDYCLSLDEVSRRIADDKPETLVNGFIVTEDGHYLGIGTALTLMAKSAEQAARRARELDEARHVAEEASKAKTSFLANMSHELRTPLNAVIGFAELMKQETFGPLGHERYQEYAQDIGASGRHLLGLINDLLDLAKAEANRMELVEQRIDVRSVVAACRRLIAEQAERELILLEVEVPAILPVLNADERKFRQMLLNLMSNAVKFTPAGGRVRVSVEVRACGDLAVAVADTGIGMSPEEQVKALEPFGQVDNRLSRRHKGTGLGLPLTRRLIELHGGALEIVSAEGAGTTVTLVFPVVRLFPL